MPSPKILAQKKESVKRLAAELKEAQSIVFTDYKGLTVAQDTEMRAAFRKEGVEYRVIKNNISRRALESLDIETTEELLGPTALAFSTEDVVLAPRLVKKYSEEFKIKIKGGVVEGKLAEMAMINQLASIPTQETLYGQLVSSLLFPITSLAMTLNAAAKACEEQGLEQLQDLAAGVEAKPTTEEAEPVAEAAKTEPAENAQAAAPAAETKEVTEAKPQAEAEASVEEAKTKEPAEDAE